MFVYAFSYCSDPILYIWFYPLSTTEKIKYIFSDSLMENHYRKLAAPPPPPTTINWNFTLSNISSHWKLCGFSWSGNCRIETSNQELDCHPWVQAFTVTESRKFQPFPSIWLNFSSHTVELCNISNIQRNRPKLF